MLDLVNDGDVRKLYDTGPDGFLLLSVHDGFQQHGVTPGDFSEFQMKVLIGTGEVFDPDFVVLEERCVRIGEQLTGRDGEGLVVGLD